MDIPAVECSPRESPVYGGCKLSVLVASASCSHTLFDSGNFYLVFEGSELRHVVKVSSVTYQQVDKLICFSAITPGHNKSESVRISLCKFENNQEILVLGNVYHLFAYDGHYQLAQYMLNCHMNDQLYRLAEDNIQEICNVKLNMLNDTQRHQLDVNLSKAFKHVIGKHDNTHFNLLHHTSMQGIRAQDTLVHFACKYGMLNLVQLLVQLPGGDECLLTPDTDGQLPVDVAHNARHVQFANILSRGKLSPERIEEDSHVMTTNMKWVNRDLVFDITELNRMINSSCSSNVADQFQDYERSNPVNTNSDDSRAPSWQPPPRPAPKPAAATAASCSPPAIPAKSPNNNNNSSTHEANANCVQAWRQPNLTDEDKTSKLKSSTPTQSSRSKILEDNILKLRQIHEEIQQIRSVNAMQMETCDAQNVQPSRSWPAALNTSGANMNSDGENRNNANICNDQSETYADNKSVKIRVNDVTPSGSQELLCSKNANNEHKFRSQCVSSKETVDGHSGNVKKQLEQRVRKLKKDTPTRRQSWCGDQNDDQNQNPVTAMHKGQLSHSSLSSMDSDADETFFDAQDAAAICSNRSSADNGGKPKRPSSAGDIDMTGELAKNICDPDGEVGEYTSRSSPSSLSLQCLYDDHSVISSKEPRTTDDICSKSLSEHQIAKMLNTAPLAPPRSLLKSVSTPSIIDSNENWSESSVTMDDCQTSVIARKKLISASSPNHDSDEDKPFKSKKRSSFFFKKKWGKEKEVKKSSSSHQFVTVCYSNSTLCDVCAKSMCNKQALCCETCLVKVHDSSCREQISDCTKLKNSRVVTKTASYSQPHSGNNKEKLMTSASFKIPPSGPMFPGASPHQRNKRQSDVALSVSAVQEAIQLNSQKSNSSSPSKVISEDKDSDMLEDSHMTGVVETNSASVESLEDASDNDSDLDDDAELQLRSVEPEQWSDLVDKKFTKKMKDKDVKRQESIYELILTEKHHVLTLRIMQKIFAHGMRKEVQIGSETVDRIFPSLDKLYEIHSSFLRELRERQREYTVIPTVGDLLLKQFKGEKAEQWTHAYGEFCSQHQDAVSLYKDILKSDRKFQLFIKKCSLHPLCKARAVPECMLLVTQRIMKYPLVIDSLIKATKENEEEKKSLNVVLSLVKGIISNVDGKVTEKQKEMRLFEIYNKVDAKSTAFYHGKKFKKSDLLSGNRKLLYEGHLMWKSARGKPLEVMTVVLSDIIIFLLENNQKYTFVSQDNKNAILSLQKLLVREKAGQDNKGIYLISSNPLEPEMYELSCASSKDKKAWIENIRFAIDHYPDELAEEGAAHDYNAHTKLIDVKVARIKHLLSSLHDRDMCIAQMCQEKMSILLELLESDVKPEHSFDLKYTDLLESKRDPGETRNLLMASLNEASRIASSLYMTGSNLSRSVSSVGEHQSETFTSPALPKRAETFGGFDSPNKEQNPLHKTLNKKLMIFKENEKARGCSVSCTVSPVSEHDGDHLCPSGFHEMRRLSGPPALPHNQEELDTKTATNAALKRSTNSTTSLSNIPWPTTKSKPTHLKLDHNHSPATASSSDTLSQTHTVGELLSLNAVAPSLLMAGKDQLQLSVQLTHHLNRLQCLFSQHFTSYETLKTELTELKSKQMLLDKEPNGGGELKEKRSIYKHNQRLEELRNLQEQLQVERQMLEKERDNQNKTLQFREEQLEKLQADVKEHQQDVKEQREKLYQQLEVLKRQGILLSPSMQIMNTGLQSPPLDVTSAEPHKSPIQTDQLSSWEVRASKGAEPVRKITLAQVPDKSPNKLELKQRMSGPSPAAGGLAKRADTSDRQALPAHLCSATNQQKTKNNVVVQQPSSVRQQLPMKLASLSLGSAQSPTSDDQQQNTPPNQQLNAQSESPQFLPMKLANRNKTNPMRTSSFGGSPKAVAPHAGYVHQRAGSSPAKIHELSHHSEELNPKVRNSTMPKEKVDKKDTKKYNESEIIFF